MSKNFKKLDFFNSYNEFIDYNFNNFDVEKAVEVSCGGNRVAYGYVEMQLLKQFGLKTSDSVVDVGCGYGRLAENLTNYLSSGSYLGIDVVEKLINYAKNKNTKSNVRFKAVNGLEIPAEDSSVDFISVFSVFTHMLHEDSFIYLSDMKRALKTGGKIVVSFLEFSEEDHWPVFAEQFAPREGDAPSLLYQQGNTPKYNPGIMFTERTLWQTFAKKIGLKIVHIESGHSKFIKLDKTIKLDNGDEWSDFGTIGQSIIVFEK